MSIYTIGYEGLDMNGFLALLRKGNVETVVDVRQLPLSRKTGFSKNGLAETLRQLGFKYRHIPELGCPKTIRDAYRDDSDWDRYTKGFLQHLSQQNDVVVETAAMALTSNCALLCFEANFNYCHRKMVADSVSRIGGMPVVHLHAGLLRTAVPATQDLEFA